MGRPLTVKRQATEKHFSFVTAKGCYRCKLCPAGTDAMQGVKKTNFLYNALDHLKRLHEAEYFLLSADVQQQQISASFDSVSRDERLRLDTAKAFACTVLPMNVFRSNANRTFLKSIISLGGVPNFRTIEKDMETLEKKCLARVKNADHYGIQLDHWTSTQKHEVLVVIVSWVTKEWSQEVQIVEFKKVSRTTAWVTANEVKSALLTVGLDAAKMVGFQSDNCNAMIASAR